MTSTFRAKLAFSSLALFLTGATLGESAKLPEEKELELVNFKSIKKVLEQDGLSQSAQKKKQSVQVMKKERISLDQNRYLYPSEEELWGIVSEYWLVKNAQILGWDFEKPDYGIETSFRSLLQSMGFYQKRFKILLLNTPSTVRAALPGSEGEVILLLSVPFIRSLDLSKLEIALLLLEDFFRIEQGYFKKAVVTEKLKTLAGTNFFGRSPDISLVQELLKNYDHQIQSKGYSFQQQFEITKRMDSFLKPHPEKWNAYFRLLQKMDRFLKPNQQYKDYIRLYPSPEMQLKWLSPEEKVL